MKTTKKCHKSTQELVTFFYELPTLTRDVTCSELYRDGENIFVSFCQKNTLLQVEKISTLNSSLTNNGKNEEW